MIWYTDMNNSLESFHTIESYFEAFRSRLEECRAADTYVAADWQDNYTRLARLRNRYLEEKHHLNRTADKALSKVFEGGTFIDGMMHIRVVSEHVTKRCDLVIRTIGNAPSLLLQTGHSTPFLTATRYYLDFDLPVHFQSPGCAATHVGLHRAPVFKSSAHMSE